jgi:GNAT superfamily N-acetyltransferase
MIRLRPVPTTPKWRGMLDYLQLACLPGDDPCGYKPRDLWWIAFDAGTPVAFAGVRPTAYNPSIWYLFRAGVIPSARGNGLQKRLIRVRLAGAARLGADMVVTDTRASNCASANSLIAAGFRTYNPASRWALPDSVYWRKKLP